MVRNQRVKKCIEDYLKENGEGMAWQILDYIREKYPASTPTRSQMTNLLVRHPAAVKGEEVDFMAHSSRIRGFVYYYAGAAE